MVIWISTILAVLSTAAAVVFWAALKSAHNAGVMCERYQDGEQ